MTHSRIGHYFFSYLLTCEVYLIEVLENMAQIKHFCKPETNKGEFRLYFELFEKKLEEAPTTQKQKQKP